MAEDIITSLDDDVVTVVIDNPRRLNALSLSMWHKLQETFLAFHEDASLRCIIITGAGEKAFSAGADISEFESTRSNREQVVRFHEEFVGPALSAIRGCDVPVIAKIKGVCMGGGLEIAGACDIRLGDPTCRLGAPVARLGFPLAFGETQELVRLVGISVATELLIESRVFSAQEAVQRGILTRVSAAGEIDKDAAETAASIKRGGRDALRSHKKQLRRLRQDVSPVSLSERMEVYSFADTNEYLKGYKTFLEKGTNTQAS